MGAAAETYRLVLPQAAPVDELKQWLESAPARARAIYATGPDLPHGAPGVLLVQQWVSDGLVSPFRVRDEQDPKCWEFLIEKAGVGVPEPAQAVQGAASITKEQKSIVLRQLVKCARQSRPCPSNAELAQLLGLPRNEKSRQRARYILERLQFDRAISVETPRAFSARVVTIAKGPWAGRKTAEI